MSISVHVLTKNSAETLLETLQSLASFPEVIVLDTGSTDETLEIASQFPNVKVHEALLKGFGPAHNLAAKLSTHDWILSIDSDEILSPELILEIKLLTPDPSCVYAMERENYFNNKRIRCCAGWYPDFVIRLYNRKSTSFSSDIVHEKVIVKDLKVIRLRHGLKHVPYRSIADFLNKMQTYSMLFTQQYQGKKKSSVGKAVLHGTLAFLKNYLLKRGIFGGREGFIISLYNAQVSYYKYLKLAEANRSLKHN